MANTYSTDLESGSSQYFSRTDANMSAGFPGKSSGGGTGDFTIEFWYKPESSPAPNQTLISKFENTTGNNRSYMVQRWSTGMVLNVSSDGTSGNSENLFKAMTVSDATWQHIAIVWDASASSAEFFLDTVSQGAATGSITSIYQTPAVFAIGAVDAGGTPVQFADGLINNMRVWGDKRTSGEISANWKTVLSSGDNLEGSWFNETNDGVDLTSNNNDLTNNNSATFSADVPFVEGGGPANVKTVNGIAIANVKTYNGIDIADVKSINGIE